MAFDPWGMLSRDPNIKVTTAAQANLERRKENSMTRTVSFTSTGNFKGNLIGALDSNGVPMPTQPGQIPKPIQYRSDGAISRDGGRTFTGGANTSISPSYNGGSSSIGDLQNVFTSLGNISETKAKNDQRRFREDLPFQSRVYQDFDTEADKRREGIDTRAREQNSNLTKDRMRLQSQQNIAEEQNRGKVQVSTTAQTRDADLKRALSVLPKK